MDRVIRVNVHLGEEQIKFLDALRKEINGDKYYDTVSKADLIRWALVKALGAPKCSTSYYGSDTGDKVKKVLKERQKTAAAQAAKK